MFLCLIMWSQCLWLLYHPPHDSFVLTQLAILFGFFTQRVIHAFLLRKQRFWDWALGVRNIYYVLQSLSVKFVFLFSNCVSLIFFFRAAFSQQVPVNYISVGICKLLWVVWTFNDVSSFYPWAWYMFSFICIFDFFPQCLIILRTSLLPPWLNLFIGIFCFNCIWNCFLNFSFW